MPYLIAGRTAKLYYERWGKGQPVVLVHALSLNRQLWDAQVPALTEHYQTIVYDLRGHGLSEKSDCLYSLRRYADDLAELLVKLALREVILIGCSIGSWIALDYVHRERDRVSRLVLASTSPKLLRAPGWIHGVSSEFFDEFLKNLTVDRARATYNFYKGLLGPDATNQLLDWIVEISLTMPLVAFIRSAENVIYADQRPMLRDIDIPTIVLNGAHDPACPPGAGEYIVNNMRQARLVTLQKSGHFPNLEEVSKFNAEVLKFLAEHG